MCWDTTAAGPECGGVSAPLSQRGHESLLCWLPFTGSQRAVQIRFVSYSCLQSNHQISSDLPEFHYSGRFPLSTSTFPLWMMLDFDISLQRSLQTFWSQSRLFSIWWNDLPNSIQKKTMLYAKSIIYSILYSDIQKLIFYGHNHFHMHLL